MMMGIIKLLEKMKKDPLYIKNWLPLTMLNADYKIYAKILSNRLDLVLPYLIHQDQVGFLKQRYIAQNLNELYNSIEYCENNNIAAMVMAVDFEKAFDSISWEALESIMLKFGFQKSFIEMIMICFKKFKVAISNNGIRSTCFEIYKGSKQGCPISSKIFLLIIEVIGLKIRNNPNIKPIEILSIKKLLSQYADNLWTFTSADQDTFDNLCDEYEKFGIATGLKINYNKTEILCLGSLANSDAQCYSRLPLTWSDGPVRVLGVDFYPSAGETIGRNYEQALNKVENVAKNWQNRSLSFIGKIQVVNTLMYSQFLYKLQALPFPPEDITKKFDKIVKDFIWDGKKSKISMPRLQQCTDSGDLKLINLKTEQQV